VANVTAKINISKTVYHPVVSYFEYFLTCHAEERSISG